MAEVIMPLLPAIQTHVDTEGDGGGVTEVVVGDEDIDHSAAGVIEVSGVEEGEREAAEAAALEVHWDPEQQWPGSSFGC